MMQQNTFVISGTPLHIQFTTLVSSLEDYLVEKFNHKCTFRDLFLAKNEQGDETLYMQLTELDGRTLKKEFVSADKWLINIFKSIKLLDENV